jgi:hypothetical protein
MAYATLAQGSSATVTFNDAADGLEVINRPSDQATVTLLTGAWAYGVSPLQQNGGRRVYGLTGAGSVQITAVSGALQYEYADNAIPYNGAGSLTSSEVGATKALVSDAGIPATVLIGSASPAYIAMIPGAQVVGSGSAKSLTHAGLLAELYPAVLAGTGTQTDANMWANAGYMTSVTGTGGAMVIPLSAYAPDLSKKTTVAAVNIKAAAPAGNTNFCGQGNGGNGSHGFALSARTDGKIGLAFISAAGTFGLVATNGVFFDGAEHSMLFMLHASGFAAIYRDGEIDTTWAINNATPLGATTMTQAFALGGGAGSSQGSIAGQFRGFHLLSLDYMPLNVGYIAKQIAAAPLRPLRGEEVIKPSRTICLYWGAAQSNESGSGNTNGWTGYYGVPALDTGGRSMVPSLSDRLARRGIAAIWCTTALGSTAATDSWCGRIRNWASGLNVVSGSYVLSGGTVYKCTNALGYAGTSTTAVAAGTGADGVTWTSLGAPTADDTVTLAGTGVYASTSARWDPNGLIGLAVNKSALTAGSVSQRVCLISLGQQDRYCGSTAVQFSDALQKLATYYSANGADKVLIGMTVRSSSTADYSSNNGGGAPNAANTTADGWYNAQLIPGRAAALAALASNPKVTAGWDWATAIGTVANQTLPTAVGVKSTDSVHMTDVTYETLAVPAADAALLAAGY